MAKNFVTGKGRRPPAPPPKPKLSLFRRWLRAIRNHPGTTTLKSLGGVLSLLIAVGSGVYGFVGPFWPTPPQISMNQQDPELPFALPFTASNKSILFSIKKAAPICWIYYAKTTFNFGDMGLIPKWEIQDIPADNERTFYCGLITNANAVTSAKIKISLDYNEDIFGILWHRRMTGDVFEWVQTTQGGVWVDEGYFSPNPKAPKNTIDNP